MRMTVSMIAITNRRMNPGFICLLFGVCLVGSSVVGKSDTIEFGRDVQPILARYCIECHNAQESESNVRLHNYEGVMKGGPDGPIIVPGKSQNSLMIQMVTGQRDPQMPPKDAKQPSRDEISVLQKWIDQGAIGTASLVPLRERLSRMPTSKQRPNTYQITALSLLKDRPMFGQYDGLILRTNQWHERLPFDVVGKVTQIRTTKDGRYTVVVAGIPGLGGQAMVLEHSPDSYLLQLKRVIEGHSDALYAGVLSPDGRILATAGYDRIVMLWNVQDGQLLRSLEGHNGSIYDLDFDDTGEILASASADETIKIWRVSNGERLDTLGQCEAEQYSVRFDSLRQRVLAAGADKRIRAWKIQSREKPSVSPMLYATFAHEAPITYMELSRDGQFLATAGEDKKVKLWEANDLTPLGQLGSIEDVPSGLVWTQDSQRILLSTLSGGVWQLDRSNLVITNSSSIQQPEATRPESALLARNSDSSESEAPKVVTLQESDSRRGPHNAMELPNNCSVHGVLSDEDVSGDYPGDWYAFHAKANEPWVIEINAARGGAPMDSLLDVLDAKAEPILRTRLQALRESYFTFRGKDSSIADDFRLHRWEDMELNELLYAGGEVVKLWLYPRGPDSGFKVYPGFGKRFTYFDTTATTHALNEPVWIVRELRDGEAPVPNGLPVFPVYYSNDDDANRVFGTDSKLTFTAKTDGKYLIRVRDSRGASGGKFKYQLSIRPPNPRFEFRLEQKEITLRPGVGTEFSIVVDRFDGFDGDIDVKLGGVPDSVHAQQPLTIQAGQNRAVGMLHAPDDLSQIHEFKLSVTCSAIGTNRVKSESKELDVKVNAKPAMRLKVVRKDQGPNDAPLDELVIRPGETISALLVIERGENKSDIAFGGDDSGRNLPHGCYVDNIGLSGLLIPAGQSVREFFITAARWVPEQSRYFHLRANVDGSPTTLAILIRVVPSSGAESTPRN